MDLDECLPLNLRSPSPAITKIAMGLSGAGVYRVDAAEGQFVLKVARTDESLDDWRRRAEILQLAAAAGVAPRVVHVNETRRAIVSEFVNDLSFPGLFMNPATRERALELLGTTIRRVHELPILSGSPVANPRALLEDKSRNGFAGAPAFVSAAVNRALDEAVPPGDRAPVMSHNDVNPSNIAYDGSRVLLLDWDVTAPNDAWYDLATTGMFFRMDDETCVRLISAYDGAPVSEVPPAFRYYRRLIAALSGSTLLQMLMAAGYRGTDDAAPTLGEFYQHLRAGSVNLATPEGQWKFALAILGEV